MVACVTVKFYQMSVNLMGFTDPLLFTHIDTIPRIQFTVTDSASFSLVRRHTLGITNPEHVVLGCAIYAAS